MARGLPRELRRRGPRQQPRSRFILICEGARTEPEYFAALNRLHAGALVEVDIYAQVGVPLTIAKEAAKRTSSIRKARRRDSFVANDQVWAVFDRDEHPNFSEAIALCADAGVKVARSNPCFEVWLILHYCDYGKPDGRHVAQKEFSELHTSYDPRRGKGISANEIIEHIEVAEARAEAQLRARENEGQPYGAPSTTVGRLTASIRTEAQRWKARA